ncbi:MAG: MarR family transcriptional regulator [Oscillospiraceae bacterium]
MAYTSRDMRRFNHLLQETDAVYHEMAQHWGLSDSVMGVLYTLCDAGGRCPPAGHLLLERHDQEDRQLRPASDGGRRADLSGGCRTGQGRLPDAGGEALVQRTARRVIQAENQVFAAWPQEDVEQYLALTRRFQEALAQKAREIKEKS